jgi:hypothetical protein
VIGDHAYYEDLRDQHLYVVPLAGGPATDLLPMAPMMTPGATDGSTLFVSSYAGAKLTAMTPPAMRPVPIPLLGGELIDAIAVYGDWIYVAAQDLASRDPSNGLIERVPKAGGTAERIVGGIGHPWSLVAGSAGLFWEQDPPTGTYGNGDIMSAASDGSGVAVLVKSVAASGLALEGDTLIFASDIIGKVPVSGGSVAVVASGVTAPGFLTVVGGNVVWVDRATKALSDAAPSTIETACL